MLQLAAQMLQLATPMLQLFPTPVDAGISRLRDASF
jgi:hypothetical protein